MSWSQVRKIGLLAPVVCLALSLTHDGRAATDPQENGIFVQAVKTYDEGALESLLATAINSLSRLNGFDSQSLNQALGKPQGAQVNQSAAAFNISGPGGPAPPGTPLPTAPTLPTNSSVSSLDLLNEQVQLTMQVINIQMLLGSSLNDLSPPGDPAKPKRKRTTLGFPIYITVPPGFRYQQAVAEVEVSVCTPSDAAHRGAPTLMNLLPREKTYNVASIVNKGASIGGGGIAGILSLSGGLMRGHQTYYLVRDQDTLAMQRPPDGSCPGGGVPVTFAWQFRPVLGQTVVRDGLRQTFSQISLPGSQNDPEVFGRCPSAVYVRTCWRRYDAKTGRVGTIIGNDRKQVLRAETFGGPPSPDSVSVQDNNDGSLTVTAFGSYLSGTAIRVGGSVQSDGFPGFEHNDRYIRFKIDALSYAQSGAVLVKDGVEVAVKYPPVSQRLFHPEACEESRLANPIFDGPRHGKQNEWLKIKINDEEARNVHRESPYLVFRADGKEWKAALNRFENGKFGEFGFTVPYDLGMGQYSVTLATSKSKEEVPAGTFTVIGAPAKPKTPIAPPPQPQGASADRTIAQGAAPPPHNQATVVPYDAATSLVKLFRPAKKDETNSASEVVVVGKKVFGLRDNPFVERTGDYVSLLVPNELIRTIRSALWKDLISGVERTYSLLSSDTGISDFNITAITPLSQPATTSSSSAPAPAPVNLTVTTNDRDGGVQIAKGTGLMAIGNGSPSLLSMSPASGAPGDTLKDNVTITGAFTHFKQGVPEVFFSDPRVQAHRYSADDDTHLKIGQVDIGPSLEPPTASVNVTLISGPETAVGAALFNVIKSGPRITVAPTGVAVPATNVLLTITGTRTKFKQTPLSVKFGDPNITLATEMTPSESDTQLSIRVNVAPKAPSGPSDLTVSYGSDSVTGQLVINPDAPALVSVSPAAFRPGQTYERVTIVGKNTTFGLSSKVTFNNAALTASDETPDPNDRTRLLFTLNVAGDAASSAPPAAGSKGSNVYLIAGSNLTGLKILMPPVEPTFYGGNDTYATFSLTDEQVQKFKSIFVKHGNEYLTFSLPAPPAPPAAPTGGK